LNADMCKFELSQKDECRAQSAESSKAVVFNLSRDPRGVVNHFGRDRVVILYVHSCITFALFEF